MAGQEIRGNFTKNSHKEITFGPIFDNTPFVSHIFCW